MRASRWPLVGPALYVGAHLALLLVPAEGSLLEAGIPVGPLADLPPPLALLAVEVGLLAILGLPLLGSPPRLRTVLAFLVGLLLLGLAAVVPFAMGGATWQAALSLALVAAGLAYGLHRYELVRLGLVGGTEP